MAAARRSLRRRCAAVLISACIAFALVLFTATSASAEGPDAIITPTGYDANSGPMGDDDSDGPISLPFTIDYFGTDYSSLHINSNGNVTFGGGMTTYTPFNIIDAGEVIMAPFFADVDMGGGSAGTLTYGTATWSGRAVFCVTWDDVGHYNDPSMKRNSFQLVLVDRSDVAAGDFDMVFNYDKIEWETGDASGGSDGLGGNSARAGYSNGVDEAYELEGSGVNGAFLDSSITGLIHDSRGTSQLGRYIFEVRSGAVVNSPPTISVSPVSLEGNTVGGYSGSIPDASASDPDGTVTSFTNDAPDVLPLGDTVVEWTAVDDEGASSVATQVVTITDTTPPTDPGTYDSASHTVGEVSYDDTIDVSWSADATDVVGVDGYSISWTQDATATPDQVKNLEATTLSITSPPLDPGTWYFNLRTVDEGGNWTSTGHLGPFILGSGSGTSASTPASSAWSLVLLGVVGAAALRRVRRV